VNLQLLQLQFVTDFNLGKIVLSNAGGKNELYGHFRSLDVILNTAQAIYNSIMLMTFEPRLLN
jgi:hypothetical protein